MRASQKHCFSVVLCLVLGAASVDIHGQLTGSAPPIFQTNFVDGCMESCVSDMSGSEILKFCSTVCKCQFEFLAHVFQRIDTPLGFNIFTKSAHPNEFREATEVGGSWCVLSRLPEYDTHARVSPFMEACSNQNFNSASRASKCFCIDREFDRFSVSNEDRIRLGTSAQQGRLPQAISDWAEAAYPGLDRRVESCGSGLSRYNKVIEEQAKRLDEDELQRLEICSGKIYRVATLCSYDHGSVPSSAIRNCSNEVETFSELNPCQGVSASEIDKHLKAQVTIKDRCALWGADVEMFAERLNQENCMRTDSATRLRIYDVPTVAGILAMKHLPGLVITDGDRLSRREGRFYVIEGEVKGETYVVRMRQVGGLSRFSDPNVTDFEVVETTRVR